MVTYIIVCFIGYSLVVGQGVAAWKAKWFTPGQMLGQGITKGLPLVAHLGWVGDAIYITPAVAWIIDQYSSRWSLTVIVVTLVVAIITAALMVALWKKPDNEGQGVPEAHTEDFLTGALHFAYMAPALSVFVLFFLTSQVSPGEALAGAGLLAFHGVMSTHMFIGFCGFRWYPVRPDTQKLTKRFLFGVVIIMLIAIMVSTFQFQL